MHNSESKLPSLQILKHCIETAFVTGSSLGEPVTILARELNPCPSTYPAEVVTCRLADGREVRLFCKYAGGRNHNAHGHRAGIAYEAEVYRRALQSLPVNTPGFYGTYEDETTGEIWLMLEYLDNSVLIKHSHYRTLIPAAARWLGQFHRANERLLPASSVSFLHRYDADYYLGWAVRTSRYAGQLHQRFLWLADLCKRFEEIIDMLLEPPTIMIHGEFYPGNILSWRGVIYPVDWESSAIARGELDLATLIEGWPGDIAKKCITEYQSARWPKGKPADFEPQLEAAQIYWYFRWLGDRPAWTHQEEALVRFEQLHTLGERFGLI